MLRQSLRSGASVHVCDKSASIRRATRAIFPVYSPEVAAGVVVRLAERPRPEAFVGAFAYVLMIATRLAPMLLERLVAKTAVPLQFKDESAAIGSGNLYGCLHSRGMTGGWQEYWKRKLLSKSTTRDDA